MHTSLRTAAVALVLVAGVAVAAGTAAATTAQFPTETTVAPFPTETTLAPGVTVPATVPGATVADTTPTTSATTAGAETQVDQTPSAETETDAGADRTVWVAIGGLGVVAVLILVLTIIYARHTRPDRWHGGQEEWDVPDSPDDVFAPTAARSVFEHQQDEQGFWWAED